jgi:hypothetical protein
VRLKVAAAVVLLVAVGLVGYFLVSGSHGAVAAAQGDCIEVVSAQDARTETVDCGSPEAVYRVAKRLDSASGACPDGEYSELTSGRSVKLCLMLNAHEGDCLTTMAAGRNQTHQRVPCDGPATYQVRKLVVGRQDPALCDQGNVVASYSEPALTVCLVPRT